MSKTSSLAGVVTAINQPLVTVTGLTSARPQEKVIFSTGEMGVILHCNTDSTQIMVLSSRMPKIGDTVQGSKEPIMVPVGQFLLGKVISPLGIVLSTNKENSSHNIEEIREIDIVPSSLNNRAPITESLFTGLSRVDMLLPLAKGQREMIIGDRKTGKSQFLLQILLAQVQLGSKVVYCFIGKRQEEIAATLEFVQNHEIEDAVSIVASNASDPSSIISLTPFTAMTVAEYFRDQGDDVTIIFDDLTTHAKYYREVALLNRAFPGRDSYPGDIFYVHARLLERAGKFIINKGQNTKQTAAISAFPVAETLESELTDYIVSNLISITDGHLLFDTHLLQRGIRPAIETNLSVTRVGKQTLSSIQRSLNRALSLLMNRYEKTQQLSHFGSELSEETKQILQRGKSLQAFLNQSNLEIIPQEVQVVMSGALLLGWWDQAQETAVINARRALSAHYNQDSTVRSLFHTLNTSKNLEELSTALKTKKKTILKLCNQL